MDSKKFSVVMPVTMATAILFAGAIVIEGIALHSTHSFNVRNLHIRSKFNNFLNSEKAKKVQKENIKSFNAVSEFVKNNGNGTLIAQSDTEKEGYFEFKYYENGVETADSEPKKPKIKILKNWQAVEEYLKDICNSHQIQNNTIQKDIKANDTVTTSTTDGDRSDDDDISTDNSDTTDNNDDIDENNARQKLRDLQKEAKQKKKEADELSRQYFSSLPVKKGHTVNRIYPSPFYKLTEQEQNQIKEKLEEYETAYEDWLFAITTPACMVSTLSMIKSNEAEIRMYELDIEAYKLQMQLYSKVNDSE